MEFTQEELMFIEQEFGYTAQDIAEGGEDILLEIGDLCFDIELEGDLQDGNKVSDRCGMASAIYQRISSM